MDVVALYPNLRIKRSAEEVGREMLESDIKYSNVDYVMAGRFVASNMSQEEVNKEGLQRIVPRRRCKFGARPGGTTKELYDKREVDNEGEEIEKDSK